jgi:hypothetical protein
MTQQATQFLSPDCQNLVVGCVLPRKVGRQSLAEFATKTLTLLSPPFRAEREGLQRPWQPRIEVFPARGMGGPN